MTGKVIYDQQVNIQAGSIREFSLNINSGIYFAEISDETGSIQIIKINITE
ncbi:MAG: T9SS type A sorting domain-containing protein [Flavobacteriales bacterium]|nr:T9SS type A sorting domain-containing protein [Flavobacteriales bacterium]